MTSQKVIIFDSSVLISFAMNGLFQEIKDLKKIFNGKFVIPKEVRQEIIDKPLTIKRFELEALKLKNLIDEKIIELPDSLGIEDSEISEKTQEYLDQANNLFVGKDKTIKIIDLGEAACLALSKMLSEEGVENVIAIDERTTRMLGEKPKDLLNLLQKRLHIKINYKTKDYTFFKGFKFIRSAELIYVAYKKGLIKLKDPQTLDALLYALKFKGCAISNEEIKEIKAF